MGATASRISGKDRVKENAESSHLPSTLREKKTRAIVRPPRTGSIMPLPAVRSSSIGEAIV